ncbi:MAG: dipeptidase [Verrucomicrobiota bacterium]|jgi:dipeptidase E
MLISNSTLHGGGYLDHVEQAIKDFLGPVRNVLFFPFALFDRDGYSARARERFATMGYTVQSAHSVASAQEAIRTTDAFFVGGGNTFRLLKALQEFDLIEPVRRRVREGVPYMGSSAGSNVAGPTIRTTNDMPIVQPRSLNALGLVPFQINPHFQDPDPRSRHMGETREERIIQFLEENETPVLGMREGAWIVAEGGTVILQGTNGARIFRRGHEPVEAKTGDDISALVGAPSSG